jgi:hypothetical protein
MITVVHYRIKVVTQTCRPRRCSSMCLPPLHTFECTDPLVFLYGGIFPKHCDLEHPSMPVILQDLLPSTQNFNILLKPQIRLAYDYRLLTLVRQYDFSVLFRYRKTSDTVFVRLVRTLSEPARRFSSCSIDFSQQIAQVVLFLFLNVISHLKL